MRIGIDGILLQPENAGSLRYFEQLMDGLIDCADRNEQMRFDIHTNRNIQRIRILPSHPSLNYVATSWGDFLPGAIRQQAYFLLGQRKEIDLLHSTVFIPPVAFPGKTIMTLHDLTFLLYPETQKWTGRLWWRLFARRGFEKADLIISVSESTKKDACRFFNLSEDKIEVVHHYLPDTYHPVSGEAVIERYQLPDKFILFVGTLEPRKNIPTLIQIFATARNSIKGLKLVIVGKPGWMYTEIYRTIKALNISEHVIFLGYVPEEDMPGLYAAAALFVFIPKYEGFGFPVLEAMACGVPVLASDVASIAEIVEDACVLVDPDDIETASNPLVQLLQDVDKQEMMVERGLAQVKKFRKETFSTKMEQAYHKVYREDN